MKTTGIIRCAILCVVIVACFLLALGAGPAAAGEAAALRVMPESADLTVGDEAPASLELEQVSDLYALEVELHFDAERSQVLDADSDEEGVQVAPSAGLLSPDFVVQNEVDNDQGVIRYAVTQLNPSEPANGSGAIFTFVVEATAAGAATVAIEHHLLSTRDADVIPAQAEGAMYMIEEEPDSTYDLWLPLIVTE